MLALVLLNRGPAIGRGLPPEPPSCIGRSCDLPSRPESPRPFQAPPSKDECPEGTRMEHVRPGTDYCVPVRPGADQVRD